MSTKKEYTVKEAAALFSCTEGRICQALRWNNIGSKWGNVWRITRSDIHKLKKVLGYKGKNFQKTA